MSKNTLPIVIILSLILIIAAGVGGYFYGKNQSQNNVAGVPRLYPSAPLSEKNDLLVGFAQQASFQGQVTKLSGETATVMNMNNQTESFTVSKSVSIFDPTRNPKSGSPSASTKLNTIPLNKPALITIMLVNNQYQITTVLISLPFSTPHPVQSAK